MRIRPMSDLHLEAAPLRLKDIDCDVVILAGDIDLVENGHVPKWARETFPEREIIWVLGNHEHYRWSEGSGIEGCVDRARALARNQQVHLLEGDVTVIGGVRFVGCTLWTDFELQGSPYQARIHAAMRMSDFRGAIKIPDAYEGIRFFRPEDSRRIHERSVRWLESELSQPFGGETIVVTHHAPHPRCEHASHAQSPLSPAFCSDLSWMIEKYQPRLWVSGHTHASHDVDVGMTRLLSNQRGYRDVPEHPDAPFNPDLVVKL